MVGAWSDVTARKQLAETLAAAQERLVHLLSCDIEREPAGVAQLAAAGSSLDRHEIAARPVLVNPANPASESTLRDILEAARAIGLQIQVLKASTRSEIEAAFATLVRDRAEALYVAGDVFFTSRRVQLATLAATNRIPASYPSREAVEAGGLMGYDADRAGMYRQVGAYTGQILKSRLGYHLVSAKPDRTRPARRLPLHGSHRCTEY